MCSNSMFWCAFEVVFGIGCTLVALVIAVGILSRISSWLEDLIGF